MSKSGQARVPTPAEERHLFRVIRAHRYPEKNAAIMHLSFKLGLRVQEIALLQIKEVAQLDTAGTAFTLHRILNLPAAYTKGANALHRTRSPQQRKTVRFDVATFHNIVSQIVQLTQLGSEVNPLDFYPPEKSHHGRSRALPLVDRGLRAALTRHLRLRLMREGRLSPDSPLFITQKGGPYSANTFQEHMALMLRGWAGIEKASSHSGRRSLITNIIHKQKRSLRIAQKIAGHANPATTLIYDEPPEAEIISALRGL